MSAFTKVNAYSFDLIRGKHDWSAHTYKVALTNTDPTASAAVLANITQIAAGNGYVSGGPALTGLTMTQSGVTTKVVVADSVLAASGGSVGPFRYAVIYNDTQTSPLKPIVGYYDYGSSQTLADGEPFTIDFDATTGFFTQA